MANLLDKASILLTPTAHDNGSILSIKPTNGDGDFTFSRNGDASRVNSSGNIVTEGANLPRINYENGCGSWLLEDESTNLVPYSSDFSNASWLKENNATLGLNTYLSPSGENNASELNLPNTLSRITYVFNTTGVYTFSVYLRSDTNGTISIRSATGSPSVEQQVSLTDKWQRFDVSVTDGNYWQVIKKSSDTLTSIYVWGAQLEEQSYATSYIPTSGASSTRLQDIATDSGNSTLINSTEGTLYAEIAALENSGESIRAISLGVNGDNSQTITIRFRNQNNSIGLFMKPLSPNNLNLSTQAFNILNFNKIALKYKSGEIALWINGTEVITSTNTLNIVGLNKLDFNAVGSSNFFGKVKALAVYKEALTDAELTALTTI